MFPKRHRFKWSINEILTLHREYELLGLRIQDIANNHERTFDAIIHKLIEEDIFCDMDINELDDFEERKIFLEDLGLSEPGSSKLLRSTYKLLNLQTYFTAGPQEIRAWTIKKNATAPNAAGVIHTDFEKGFIRAEVIAYEDYIHYGSEAACREVGKLRVEGKEYVVKDGDVMNFLFSS